MGRGVPFTETRGPRAGTGGRGGGQLRRIATSWNNLLVVDAGRITRADLCKGVPAGKVAVCG